MYYGNIKEFSVENGTGVRVSFFVSGCRHCCKNCFSKHTWDFNYGLPYDEEVSDKIIEALRPNYIEGITILGGDPLEPENQEEVLKLMKRIREELPQKNIWMFSGFVFEELFDENCRAHTEYIEEILENLDVLVDGEFIDRLKNLSLKFRGSSNQRILNVKKSLEEKKAIVIPEYMD